MKRKLERAEACDEYKTINANIRKFVQETKHDIT